MMDKLVPLEKILEKVYNKIRIEAIKAQEQGFSSYPNSEKDYLEVEIFERTERLSDYNKLSLYKKILFFFPHLSDAIKLGKIIGRYES